MSARMVAMQWALCALALGGCQLVFPLEGPNAGSGVIGADAGMSPGDDDDDDGGATGSACAVLPSVRFDVELTFGDWFVPAVGANRAVKYLDGAIKATEISTILTAEAGYTEILTPPPLAIAAFDAPALAAGGDRLIVRARTTTGATVLMESTRSGTNAWDSPGNVELLDASSNAMPVDPNMHPTSPTATTPRRMLLNTGNDGFVEVVELSPRVWQFVAKYSAASLGIARIEHASMTENGLRVVYRGLPAGSSSPRVFTMTREAPDQPWAGPEIQLYDNADTVENFPYLSDDCARLWYTDATDGRIHQVGFQP